MLVGHPGPATQEVLELQRRIYDGISQRMQALITNVSEEGEFSQPVNTPITPSCSRVL